jgi:hypothetical protein
MQWPANQQSVARSKTYSSKSKAPRVLAKVVAMVVCMACIAVASALSIIVRTTSKYVPRGRTELLNKL